MPSRWLLMIVCQNEMVILNVDSPRSVGSVLILLHFNLLVNDLDDRIEWAYKIDSLKMPLELGGKIYT